ncbi:UNKNOWN [Stylonychia lemnae]|uniref:Uncharacterized protein n=1 Tax=Stylonychia lemnae TaxID=5949 RepID=A0A077ZSC9_STYLE|nr:UNKNOWN [Stylonychia lemnae]|eukprot:CDW72439.1 UNKNOWN [Stylonychia lemnae]
MRIIIPEQDIRSDQIPTLRALGQSARYMLFVIQNEFVAVIMINQLALKALHFRFGSYFRNQLMMPQSLLKSGKPLSTLIPAPLVITRIS